MEVDLVELKKNASQCSVLYVEDEEFIRDNTSDFLGHFFSKIDLAKDGKDGLSMYEDAKYDIVITDINMPQMNGIDMIKKIREINIEQIIMVTSAYSDSENLINMINLGVMHFILKPFNNKQFILALQQVTKEVHYRKLDELLLEQANESQNIIDMVSSGIVVLKHGVVSIANRSFLNMAGFSSFEQLKIELPEIGVIFQSTKNSIFALSNNELIETLKITPNEDCEVFIDRDGDLREYHVDYTKIEDREDYILVFTDITDIKNSLSKDEHTKLPTRKLILDHIESSKMTSSNLEVLLISIKHFENVTRWYGKGNSFLVEEEMSQILKNIIKDIAPKAYLGYFGENQFVVLPTYYSPETIQDALNTVVFSHNKELKESHEMTEIDYHLDVDSKILQLDGSKIREELEIFMIDSFDTIFD